ncbi:MAG: T9SS type A sorting domain-containing protein [Lewinellaceae bacterium]|nr:T9SS type A sorting domain-containing protein [Lewinellaceae bacterium]
MTEHHFPAGECLLWVIRLFQVLSPVIHGREKKKSDIRPMRFLVLFFLGGAALPAQSWQTLPALPEPVTNNAVTEAHIGDSVFIYSFAGLDATKTWSGIHLKAWRLRLGDTAWQALPSVPDPTGGKIAAAASTVGGKIYVIGGYHVEANGNETSSRKVHRFDPATNSWLPDGADLPLAIDDQVQAVWRDSLIFVVSGWSNTTNVNNVQIYNPATDTWLAGTPVPDLLNYKVFGGSGTIIGDTLYYAGGARTGGAFPPTTFFRKGYIHPDDPGQIDWSGATESLARGYRMGCVELLGKALWLGGSDVTYNYNGIAYNGSGGVPALDRLTLYDPATGTLTPFLNQVIAPTMDLRGVAKVSPTAVVLAGGMGPNQQVTDQVRLYELAQVVPTQQAQVLPEYRIFPNPALDFFTLQTKHWVQASLFNIYGGKVGQVSGSGVVRFSVAHLPAGVFFLKIQTSGGRLSLQKIVVSR